MNTNKLIVAKGFVFTNGILISLAGALVIAAIFEIKHQNPMIGLFGGFLTIIFGLLGVAVVLHYLIGRKL